jgi:hypothetical protein
VVYLEAKKLCDLSEIRIISNNTKEVLCLFNAVKWVWAFFFFDEKWVWDLQLNNVDFELDTKYVVDNFNSNMQEFNTIIGDCKYDFYSYFTHFSVKFIMRQINEVVHNLIRAASYLTSFHFCPTILNLHISKIWLLMKCNKCLQEKWQI